MTDTLPALSEVEPDNDCPECVPYFGRPDNHFVGFRWSPGDPILRFGPEEQQPCPKP